MKKVLFITNTFPVDNRLLQGHFNYKAAVSLNKETDIVIYHLRSWKPFRKIFQEKKIGELDVNVFSFPYYPFKSKSLQALQLIFYKKILYFFIKPEIKDVDVFHSVGASFASVVTSFIANKTAKPHIAQCIGTDVNYNLPGLRNYYGVRDFEKNVSFFTTNSKELEKRIHQLYPNSRVKTIYRGVDLAYFNTQLKYNKKKIEFTYLGGLSMRKETGLGRDYKGGITLLKAWKEIKNQNIQKLNFAGPEVSQELVNQIIGANSSTLNIQVYGLLDRNRVRELLKKTDVVIIPSWAEGLPNAGMEALASSCAILGSDVGGIPELINENGYLFDAGDSKELKKLLIKISSNLSNLNTMKKRSRHIAENKFDDKNFAKKYLALYAKL